MITLDLYPLILLALIIAWALRPPCPPLRSHHPRGR